MASAPPPVFIAEVSSNHGRDLERCAAIIDAAAASGCDVVKFQMFEVESLFAPEVLDRSPEHEARRRWELPPEFVPELAELCRAAGVRFACTPFHPDAVELLARHVDVLKIASYDILRLDLIRACAATGKEVVVSTGMATMPEVEGAVRAVEEAGGSPPVLLHCVSVYPAPPEACNLSAIQTLRDAFGCRTGWSDHTVDPAVIARAVHRWGAEVVELHLDLDARGEEYATGHCWLPDAISAVVAATRSTGLLDGDGTKVPAEVELEERDWRADPEDGLRPMRHVRARWR